jgi:hypothetical protein
VLLSTAPEKWDDMIVKEALNASDVDVNRRSTASKAILIVDHQPQSNENSLNLLWRFHAGSQGLTKAR